MTTTAASGTGAGTELAGKVALVTGAGRNIGRAIAHFAISGVMSAAALSGGFASGSNAAQQPVGLNNPHRRLKAKPADHS